MQSVVEVVDSPLYLAAPHRGLLYLPRHPNTPFLVLCLLRACARGQHHAPRGCVELPEARTGQRRLRRRRMGQPRRATPPAARPLCRVTCGVRPRVCVAAPPATRRVDVPRRRQREEGGAACVRWRAAADAVSDAAAAAVPVRGRCRHGAVRAVLQGARGCTHGAACAAADAHSLFAAVPRGRGSARDARAAAAHALLRLLQRQGRVRDRDHAPRQRAASRREPRGFRRRRGRHR